MPPRNTEKKKAIVIETPVIVALITLVGTLATAYLAFLSVKVQRPAPPVNTPVTAVRNDTSSGTANLPSEPQEDVVVPTPTVAPSQTPATPTVVSELDVTNLIQVTFEPFSSPDYCNMAVVLPVDINPQVDPVKAKDQFLQSIEDETAKLWQRAPVESSGVTLVEFRSVVESSQWIRMDSTIPVNVSVVRDVPEHLNIVQDCAEASTIREFTPVTLAAGFRTYQDTVTYEDADFFTLEPGEFEIFGFFHDCSAPGIYQVEFNIPYDFRGQKGDIQFKPPTIVCPKTYTKWSVLAGGNDLVSLGTFSWNGTEYTQTQ